MTRPCRLCGAPIAFVKMQRSGVAMPVDPQTTIIIPDPKGTAQIVTSDGRTFRGRDVDGEGALEPTAVLGHLSHYATCPHAEAFRKKRARGEQS